MTAPARRTAPRRSPLREAQVETEPTNESPMLNTAPPMEMRRSPVITRRRFKAWKIIAGFFAAIILIPLAIAIVIGTVEGITGSVSTSSSTTTVKDFNDGFATAKQDDCQQGDANACKWLKDQGMTYK